MDDPARQQFFALIQNPSRETYLPVWQAVTSSPEYDPSSDDVSEVQQLFEEGKYEEARAKAFAVMGKWLLSPRLHLLVSLAARKLGDEQAAQMENIIASACAEGILGTGDGTEEKPYLVTSTGDEYDILQYLQKTLSVQALVHSGDRTLDRMTCTDGTVLHFDITAAYVRLTQRMRPQRE